MKESIQKNVCVYRRTYGGCKERYRHTDIGRYTKRHRLYLERRIIHYRSSTRDKALKIEHNKYSVGDRALGIEHWGSNTKDRVLGIEHNR